MIDYYNLGQQIADLILPLILIVLGIRFGIKLWKKRKTKDI